MQFAEVIYNALNLPIDGKGIFGCRTAIRFENGIITVGDTNPDGRRITVRLARIGRTRITRTRFILVSFDHNGVRKEIFIDGKVILLFVIAYHIGVI
jgi:hypothetical protein